MGYPNGLVQDRLTEKFDKVTVFHKEEPLSNMFDLGDQSCSDNETMDEGVDHSVDNVGEKVLFRGSNATALAIDKYSLDFCVTSKIFTKCSKRKRDDKWSISPPESKEFEDSNQFFYELEEKKNSVKQGYVIDDVKRQYDDPKSVAFRREIQRRILEGDCEVEDNVYGPPNGDVWEKMKYPLYSSSEVAKTVIAEPKSEFTARYFHPAADTPVSLDAFKSQSRSALSSYKRRTEFRSYIGSDRGQSSGIMNSGKWEPWEDVTMKQAVSVFGPNWHLIAEMLNSSPKSRGRCRSAAQCQSRLQKLNLQTFRSREYTKYQDVISTYQWAAKPTTRDDLLWAAPAPYETASVEDYEGKEGLNTPSISLRTPAKTSLKPALDLETKDLLQNIEHVLHATNNEAKPPPILNEHTIRMTNEPSAAHESHAQAAAKANAEGFQSPIQIMRAKKRRRVEREREKIQAVKLDANSRFRSTKPINPFSKSSSYTRRLHQRQNAARNANVSLGNNASSSNSRLLGKLKVQVVVAEASLEEGT